MDYFNKTKKKVFNNHKYKKYIRELTVDDIGKTIQKINYTRIPFRDFSYTGYQYELINIKYFDDNRTEKKIKNLTIRCCKYNKIHEINDDFTKDWIVVDEIKKDLENHPHKKFIRPLTSEDIGKKIYRINYTHDNYNSNIINLDEPLILLKIYDATKIIEKYNFRGKKIFKVSDSDGVRHRIHSEYEDGWIVMEEINGNFNGEFVVKFKNLLNNHPYKNYIRDISENDIGKEIYKVSCTELSDSDVKLMFKLFVLVEIKSIIHNKKIFVLKTLNGELCETNIHQTTGWVVIDEVLQKN
ncbi:hypothetical protein QLL95_gp0181 [Cotonvirus japonicus]|uniref:Uncharacterized protein n=1 Tax=Cotonvirus japonicus TaxID=2811091 RepID=A0ABM7NR92_9VIRU|nr:hypothetical protein QLL95_gp0181 [Cotonvirus japonicus]BCS82670.1 hypothetical protein [Cotonvirus japonicus]